MVSTVSLQYQLRSRFFCLIILLTHAIYANFVYNILCEKVVNGSMDRMIMVEAEYMQLNKWRVIIGGMLIVVTALLLSLLATSIRTSGSSSQFGNTTPTSDIQVTGSYDSPNVVANGISMASDETGHALGSMGQFFGSTGQAIGQTIGDGSRSIAVAFIKTGKFVTHSTTTSIIFAARSTVGGIWFIVHTPGKMFSFVSKTNVVSAVVRPADHTPVPVIDPKSPALLAARTALPAVVAIAPTTNKVPAPPQTDSAPEWPLHGAITTEFGVPELPYQAIHTGLDISDGRRPGSTPVKPFRSGRVIETIRSRGGLGNHVVIDHGSGVTSVYGHLDSISVEVGQAVDKLTLLGYEGTTGVSTGTHLHFEIRINGQAANPHQFISGHP